MYTVPAAGWAYAFRLAQFSAVPFDVSLADGHALLAGGHPEAVLREPGAAGLGAQPVPQFKVGVVGLDQLHAVLYHRGAGDPGLLCPQPGPFAVLFLPVQVPGGQLLQLELDALGFGLDLGLVAVDDLLPHDRLVERLAMISLTAASTSSRRTMLPQPWRWPPRPAQR